MRSWSWIVLLAAAICIAPAYAADSPAPLRHVRSIAMPNIEGRIDHFAIDLQHQTAFVAALGADTVVAVDLNQGKVSGSITGLKEPQGLLYVPENDHLYVANGGDGSLRIYDARTLKQVKTVALGDDADNIRYDAGAKRVWVGFGSGALAALDLDGNKLEEIAVGEHPEAFTLASRDGKLFVNVPRKKEVVVIDRNSRKMIATFGTGSATSNYPMAFDETSHRIFIACRTPARLVVLNSENGSMVADLDTVGVSDDLFYDPTRHQVYVLGGAGFVATYSQINADTYREISRLATGPGGRTGLFIPQLNELLIALPRRGNQDASVEVYQVQ